ncbi:ribonuclease D [Sphingorhabdus lutea]|uniref:Ribonuclease D n=1 Tax=Sphingorhabdus lutea TaxID=1913578 RepID=A0A1L3JCH8_9SPHN|nr:ribonuclease D [Sphingorhabdus lutea]APG62845.1 ribonuclease D [Sphingorhabdus lutea]
MMIHPLVTDSEQLAALCALWENAEFLAIDTEFMRENTYYPLLCLVQVSDGKNVAAIDPLAKNMDLKPLLDLICGNENILKLFHAGGQDIEIFYNLTGKTPHPMFDTQIAAMALGQGEQIGYSNLVNLWLGHQLDKGARFTDWSRRPLDKRQIDYAIGDVTHLAELFPKMLDKLVETGRGAWLDKEMERIANPENYANDPETSWQRIKIQSRNPDALGRLKALAAWREREAQHKDIPRGRIMKDETLSDIATNPPKDQHSLARVRGLSGAWSNNDIGKRLMGVITNAKPMPKDEIPSKKRGVTLGRNGSHVADLLKLLLKIRSNEMDVAPRLISKADELEKLAAGVRKDLDLLEGWRYDIFGHEALDLVEGRIGFTVNNGKISTFKTGGEDENKPADAILDMAAQNDDNRDNPAPEKDTQI